MKAHSKGASLGVHTVQPSRAKIRAGQCSKSGKEFPEFGVHTVQPNAGSGQTTQTRPKQTNQPGRGSPGLSGEEVRLRFSLRTTSTQTQKTVKVSKNQNSPPRVRWIPQLLAAWLKQSPSNPSSREHKFRRTRSRAPESYSTQREQGKLCFHPHPTPEAQANPGQSPPTQTPTKSTPGT